MPLVVGLTLLAAAGVAAVGACVSYRLRRRSLRYQLLIATTIPVLGVVATVVGEVRLEIVSPHDAMVVLLALAAALVSAVSGAYLVFRRIVAASLEVAAGLHELVTDTSTSTPGAADPGRVVEAALLPEELAQMVDGLAVARSTVAQARTRERASEQSRRELVSFLSHDLRTPLAGLRALSEGLEDGVIVDLPRTFGRLSGTITRMTGLVDDLFALSRVLGPPTTKPQRLVSLTEVLIDVASELTSTAAARGVEIDLVVPEPDRLAVLGVPDDLIRALTNLVANAIRHTDPGLAVRLVGRRGADGRIQVAVIDACGGIPQDSLPHVFDAGWRGAPPPDGDHGGAGLGLAIARGVVHSHAGQIAVRNVIGGCRFEVDLPPPVPPHGQAWATADPTSSPARSASGPQPGSILRAAK